jgi:DNA replication protein DnaC
MTAERTKRCFLAVIDNFGGENNFLSEQSCITGVLSSRYESKLPTIITTTLSMPDIAARYGGRVFDMLTEDIGNGGRIVDYGNLSMRNMPGWETGRISERSDERDR